MLEKESKTTLFQAFLFFFSGFWLIFQVFLRVFWLIFDSFSGFFDPGAERPRKPCSAFFRSFLGRGLFDPCRKPTIPKQVPKISLAIVQPQTCTGAPWGCCKARDIFGTPAHPPKKKRLLAPSPIDLGAIREFGGCARQSGSQS